MCKRKYNVGISNSITSVNGNRKIMQPIAAKIQKVFKRSWSLWPTFLHTNFWIVQPTQGTTWSTTGPSLMRAIIAPSHLPFLKIFSNFVPFCPNFQIACPFLAFLIIFPPFLPFLWKIGSTRTTNACAICSIPFELKEKLAKKRKNTKRNSLLLVGH